VTTNVPGCRDTVEDGRSGWLCRAQDGTSLATAIAEALSSRHELVRRGSRAATLARERFSLEQVIAQTLDVYERSLAANGLR
jgi:glycosyltransferase involved in cell wall biosynthesis